MFKNSYAKKKRNSFFHGRYCKVVGANIVEATSSISKAEFSAKISIAYKEARETGYRSRLLIHGGYLNEKTFNACCKLLYSILKSSGRIKQ